MEFVTDNSLSTWPRKIAVWSPLSLAPWLVPLVSRIFPVHSHPLVFARGYFLFLLFLRFSPDELREKRRATFVSRFDPETLFGLVTQPSLEIV